MNRLYPTVAQRAGHRCEYCRAPEAVHSFAFEVEHTLPRTRGGGDELNNLALACRACNAFKSDAVQATDPETGQPAPVFNPRVDVWDVHFNVGDDDRIAGLTPVGRATVARLNLNADRRVVARGRWRALNLFP